MALPEDDDEQEEEVKGQEVEEDEEEEEEESDEDTEERPAKKPRSDFIIEMAGKHCLLQLQLEVNNHAYQVIYSDGFPAEFSCSRDLTRTGWFGLRRPLSADKPFIS